MAPPAVVLLNPLAASQAVLGTRPDAIPLRDTLHRELSLESFRGKPLLVSFVYTGCFQVCPITTQYLARAVRSMRDALGRDAFRVVTIGFNQPFDGPEAMAAYARQNGINDPDWAFLSVDAKQIGELTRQFGFSYQATPKGFDHIAQVTVVGADGAIYRQVYGDTFDLPLLAEPVKELLSGEVRRASTLDDVWTRVKLYCTVYDPVTGGYRANYSLFVEIFAGLSILGGVLLFLLNERRRRPRSV